MTAAHDAMRAHARQRGQVTLSDGRTAVLLFFPAEGRGGRPKIQFDWGGVLTIDEHHIVALGPLTKPDAKPRLSQGAGTVGA